MKSSEAEATRIKLAAQEMLRAQGMDFVVRFPISFLPLAERMVIMAHDASPASPLMPAMKDAMLANMRQLYSSAFLQGFDLCDIMRGDVDGMASLRSNCLQAICLYLHFAVAARRLDPVVLPIVGDMVRRMVRKFEGTFPNAMEIIAESLPPRCPCEYQFDAFAPDKGVA